MTLQTKLRRKPPSHKESDLQITCVTWFKWTYPKVLIFAIPNGGARSAITGAILKREGALAGVADLFIGARKGLFCGLFIEMKLPDTKQSPQQKDFQKAALEAGYCYKISRTYEEFQQMVRDYLCF